MRIYHLCIVDPAGVAVAADVVNCEDDSHAYERAYCHVFGHYGVEIWDGARKVGCVLGRTPSAATAISSTSLVAKRT